VKQNAARWKADFCAPLVSGSSRGNKEWTLADDRKEQKFRGDLLFNNRQSREKKNNGGKGEGKRYVAEQRVK